MIDELRTYVVCSKSRDYLFWFSVSFINIVLNSSIRRSLLKIDTHLYVETILSIKRVLFHVIWFEHLESYVTLKRNKFSWFDIVFAKDTRTLSTWKSSKTLLFSHSRSSRLLSSFLSLWLLLSRCRLFKSSSDSKISIRISNVATRWTYQKSLKRDSSFCQI
jgi:hypothetical protein